MLCNGWVGWHRIVWIMPSMGPQWIHICCTTLTPKGLVDSPAFGPKDYPGSLLSKDRANSDYPEQPPKPAERGNRTSVRRKQQLPPGSYSARGRLLHPSPSPERSPATSATALRGICDQGGEHRIAIPPRSKQNVAGGGYCTYFVFPRSGHLFSNPTPSTLARSSPAKWGGEVVPPPSWYSLVRWMWRSQSLH